MSKKKTKNLSFFEALLSQVVNLLINIGTPPLVFLRFASEKTATLFNTLKKISRKKSFKKRGRPLSLKTQLSKTSLGQNVISFKKFVLFLKHGFKKFSKPSLHRSKKISKSLTNALPQRSFFFAEMKLRFRIIGLKGALAIHRLQSLANSFNQRFIKNLSNLKPSIKLKKPFFKTARPTNKKYAKLTKELALVTTGAFLSLAFVFIPFEARQLVASLPNPKTLSVRDIPISTKIYDRNGVLLYQFYADENRSLVKLTDLPAYVPAATIAIEDRNYYHHFGFDLIGMTRAAIAILQGKPIQGGSTITQQLIKSALLTPEQTISRKIKEVILAIWAERIYSKEQILTMYLNQVPYGGSTFGVQTASLIYFGKNAKDLTLAEAAYLAGLPSAPSIYSPFGTRPDLAIKRQHQVLNSMAETGAITKDEQQKAMAEELHFENPETSIKAPHFVMYVRDYLIRKYGSRRVEQGGLEVTTSLDYSLYEKTNSILRQGVENQAYLAVGNGAVLITNPKNGEILSLSGSINFFDTAHDGNVNVVVSERSPGSSIKPLNYALALENKLVTPSSIVLDTPVSYQSAGQPPYRPQNYDNRFHGPVSVRVALASSYNIPAVRLLEKNGLANFIKFAKKLGITTFTNPDRYGLALTLGGGEVTMIDMATAYSAFATGGERVNLKPVLKVKDYLGHLLEENTTSDWQTKNSSSVISGRTAYLISNILSDDNARSPTFGRGSLLNIPNHQVAVKTGTTETKRDNWTIGYTPSFLVAVWVGNNDNSPMSPFLESGNTGAAAIWNPIFQEILKNQPNEAFVAPQNLISVQICTTNGLLPCENCPQVTTELFSPGSEPKTACNFTKDDKERFQKQWQVSQTPQSR